MGIPAPRISALHHRLVLPIAAGVATALLLAFLALMQQAMRQGQTRHIEVSRQAAAWAECSRMPQRAERETCYTQVPPASRTRSR